MIYSQLHTKPFKCDECDASFGRKSNLIGHQRFPFHFQLFSKFHLCWIPGSTAASDLSYVTSVVAAFQSSQVFSPTRSKVILREANHGSVTSVSTDLSARVSWRFTDGWVLHILFDKEKRQKNARFHRTLPLIECSLYFYFANNIKMILIINALWIMMRRSFAASIHVK